MEGEGTGPIRTLKKKYYYRTTSLLAVQNFFATDAIAKRFLCALPHAVQAQRGTALYQSLTPKWYVLDTCLPPQMRPRLILPCAGKHTTLRGHREYCICHVTRAVTAVWNLKRGPGTAAHHLARLDQAKRCCTLPRAPHVLPECCAKPPHRPLYCVAASDAVGTVYEL